jgi:hypothetical protein
MALTTCDAVTNTIRSLPDEPSITSSELKEAFDSGAQNVKDWINNTHLTELDTALAGKSATTHNHNTLYYQKTDTYNKTELDNMIPNITTGTSAPVGLSEGEIYLRYKV